MKQNILKTLAIGAGFMCAAYSFQAMADPYQVVRYVKIDAMNHTAYSYDEKFVRLPDHPTKPGVSIDYLPQEQIWYLGSKIDVITRDSNGVIKVVSDHPEYYEMNHHMTTSYVSPNRNTRNECGYISPINAGSELTDIRLPSGFGYRMHGGALFVKNYHWMHGGHQTDNAEEVYLRFVTTFDDSPDGYHDTELHMIDAGGCSSTFAVPSGPFRKTSGTITVDADLQIVAVTPHIHDHARNADLMRRDDAIGVVRLHRFIPQNADIPVMHDDVGEGETPLHSHPDHLPTEGIVAWTPGANGPIVKSGTEVFTTALFNNPHERAIDNMSIFTVFYRYIP